MIKTTSDFKENSHIIDYLEGQVRNAYMLGKQDTFSLSLIYENDTKDPDVEEYFDNIQDLFETTDTLGEFCEQMSIYRQVLNFDQYSQHED